MLCAKAGAEGGVSYGQVRMRAGQRQGRPVNTQDNQNVGHLQGGRNTGRVTSLRPLPRMGKVLAPGPTRAEASAQTAGPVLSSSFQLLVAALKMFPKSRAFCLDPWAFQRPSSVENALEATPPVKKNMHKMELQ